MARSHMSRRRGGRGGSEELTPEQKAAAAKVAAKVREEAEKDVKMDLGNQQPPANEAWGQPAVGNWVQNGSLEQAQNRTAAAWRAVAARQFGNSRTRRRHRSRRRRGGNSGLKTKRQGMVKAILHEARERAKAEQRRQVMERVHKKGMEMLERRKTNSATSR